MDKTNLIFLISLPRSGSTLLQHMIANHSSVASAAEPWILLPMLYAKKKGGHMEYDHHVAHVAIQEFFDNQEDGSYQYRESVRAFAYRAYKGYLKKEGEAFFLDKTSRYYLILDELLDMFPEAKFLFLVRNPVALFASYLESMTNFNLRRFSEIGIMTDLCQGYSRMFNFLEKHPDRFKFWRYEEIVEDPSVAVKQICNYLGLDFQEKMLEYKVIPGRLVDPKSIHRHREPVKAYLKSWEKVLSNDLYRSLACDFISMQSDEHLSYFGYSKDQLLSTLDISKSSNIRLETLMTPNNSLSFWKRKLLDWEIKSIESDKFSALYHVSKQTFSTLFKF